VRRLLVLEGRSSIGQAGESAYTALRRRPAAFLTAQRCDTIVVAYDEDLANRIREIMQDEPGLTEKRMFGGLAFLINGNMAASASGQGGMLLRVDPTDTETLVARPEASRFEMRGREMDGWLRIDTTGLATKRQLKSWVSRGVSYARSLPAK
jgi:TfoX/Sxy family transcriptional regulator of competence genes